MSDVELFLQLGGGHEDQRSQEASLGLQPTDLRFIQLGENLLPLRDGREFQMLEELAMDEAMR